MAIDQIVYHLSGFFFKLSILNYHFYNKFQLMLKTPCEKSVKKQSVKNCFFFTGCSEKEAINSFAYCFFRYPNRTTKYGNESSHVGSSPWRLSCGLNHLSPAGKSLCRLINKRPLSLPSAERCQKLHLVDPKSNPASVTTPNQEVERRWPSSSLMTHFF